MAYRYEINHNLSKRVLRSHCIRLDPTPTQATYFAKGCGTARFAYNWALERWQAQYVAHLKDPSQPAPNEGALRRELNAIKRTEFPWMMEVTKCAPQEAIRALGVAYKNWFQSLSGKRKGPKVSAPSRKRKGQRDSFKIHGNLIAVDGCRIRIPLLGWVRMREPLRFAGNIQSATVSRRAHTWHVALTVETDDLPARSESQAAVGVDVGLNHLAVFSDEQAPVEGPKALRLLLQRLRRLSRAHSRKVKGSANRKKSAQRLARCQAIQLFVLVGLDRKRAACIWQPFSTRVWVGLRPPRAAPADDHNAPWPWTGPLGRPPGGTSPRRSQHSYKVWRATPRPAGPRTRTGCCPRP